MNRGRAQFLPSAAALLASAVLARAATTGPDDPLPMGSHRTVEVTVRTVEPESRRGRLLAFDMDAGLRLDMDGVERRFAAEDVVVIEALSNEAKTNARDSALTLTGGGVLYGQLLESAGPSIEFDARDVGRMTIPLESVKAFEVARATASEHRDALAWFAASPASAEDRVLFTNGDVVSGFITRLDPSGVTMDGKDGETKAPAKLVLAVQFASAHRSAAAEDRSARVDLKSGGRLRVSALEWIGRSLKLKTEFAESLEIEAERVVAVHMSGGRWEWLSDHQPISADHTPAFGTDWEMARDRNVLGRAITVGGGEFERGLGVHSRSRLVYDARGAYRQFVTSFGLDDESGPHADVAVSILVDGQPRFREESVRPGKLHGPVFLDVSGAKRIELIVDFGENADIQDRFNWVEPALIR